MCKFLCEHKLSFLCDECLKVQLLGHIVSLFFCFKTKLSSYFYQADSTIVPAHQEYMSHPISHIILFAFDTVTILYFNILIADTASYFDIISHFPS